MEWYYMSCHGLKGQKRSVYSIMFFKQSAIFVKKELRATPRCKVSQFFPEWFWETSYLLHSPTNSSLFQTVHRYPDK